ncbi:MAG: hypothetical protein U9N86_05395 [Bacteroidota bacterium]|nr:hypothetical protein [Bacteroidota bacterium]
MEQEINNEDQQDQTETGSLKHRLERTQKLLLGGEISEIRNKIENSQKFERDIMIQNIAENDLQIEKQFRETNDLLQSLTSRIDLMETEIKHLKQNKIDIQKLAIVLSDLSLQLMNISNNEKD